VLSATHGQRGKRKSWTEEAERANPGSREAAEVDLGPPEQAQAAEGRKPTPVCLEPLTRVRVFLLTCRLHANVRTT